MRLSATIVRERCAQASVRSLTQPFSGQTPLSHAQCRGAATPMNKPVRIALDALGGDFGPEVVIPGAALALERRPDSHFIFFGQDAVVRPLLDIHPKLAARSDR